MSASQEKPTAVVSVKKLPLTKSKAIRKPPKKREPKGWRFIGLDGAEHSITLRQKLFVEEYLRNGNKGIPAVAFAGYSVYKPTLTKDKNGDFIQEVDVKLASAISSENLDKPVIQAYIAVMLPQYGLTEENVNRQHAFLLNQEEDLPAKGKAIDMYRKMKGQYIDRHEVRVVQKFSQYTDAQLEQIALTGELPNDE